MDNKQKLNELFKQLRKEGFVARQNFMCCQTCALAELDAKGIKDGDNYTFYHRQDKEYFDKNNRLMLAWGGNGTKIATLAQKLGIMVNWNGTDNQRIELVF